MGRNATINITNQTGHIMTFVSCRLIYGKFQNNASPPQTIGVGSTGTFEVSNKTGAKTGPKGNVIYKVDIKGVDLKLEFFWDHPFNASASTYTASSIPGDFSAFYLVPSTPIGHTQHVTITISLVNLPALSEVKKQD